MTTADETRDEPANLEALMALAMREQRSGRLNEAAAAYRQILAVRPEIAEGHNNLGSVLALQNQMVEAATHLERAVALDSRNALAHYNLGKVLLILGQFEQAVQRFEHARSLRPDLAELQFALASCYLLTEDYERGWPQFEWRLRLPEAGIDPDVPRWRGQRLEGRSLLLLAEGGLGDTIHFLRYARNFKALGARVVLAVQPSLCPLLRSFPDVDELVGFDGKTKAPRCDFYLRLLSSAGMLGTTTATIPQSTAYLQADRDLTERWRQELAGIDGFKIGIAWQGSRDYISDRWRSIPLACFAPLARVGGVRLISLQKGFGAEQIAAVDFPVMDLSSRLDEAGGAFMDTAAVIQNLDLVVTSDTAICHLAGALGAPVWVALPLAPDWRWLRQREDSPWYPTMRLFRQTDFGQWPAVFQRIAEAATQHLETIGAVRTGPLTPDPPPAAPPDPPAPAAIEPAPAAAPDPPPATAIDLDALFQQAVHDHAAGRLAEAGAAYQQIIAHKPELVEVYNNLGILLCQQNRLDDAVMCFAKAISLSPNYIDAYGNLANVLRQQGKLDQAVAILERAVTQDPTNVGARNSLGSILREQKKLDEAVAQFEQAIAVRPDCIEVFNNLGNVLVEQRKPDQAVTRFEQAIALNPQYAEAYYGLGIAHWHQDRLDLATARFEQAVALQPDYADALNNLGSTLREQGRLAEARQVFERLESLRPGSPQSQLGLATCYLLAEDYQRGWPAFEGRLGLPGAAPQPNLPRWQGQPLAGRTLLLVGEAGFGDTLQFVRYARWFKARGARIVLAAQTVLGPLLALQPDWDELYLLGSGKALPPCDFYLPLMSAPLALLPETAAIPREVPYLSASPELIDRWQRDLAGVEGLRIGIVWQGSTDYAFDRWRSFPLASAAPLARVEGVRLISLQKGPGSEQVAGVDFPVLDISNQLDETSGPFMDTAAVIRNLDLVVAPNSSIVHLAGALGVPVWLALHHTPDWRWPAGREDSAWYPTMRIFRQQALGQWAEVFERMAAALQTYRPKVSP